MLTIKLNNKSPEFIHTPGSQWYTFTMAGTHTMQVCVEKAGRTNKSDAEKLAELLYQPAELPLNIRTALYMPEATAFSVLTGNQVVMYRGTVCVVENNIFVNCGPRSDCYVFSYASGFINAFSLARKPHSMAYTCAHINTRRTRHEL